MVYKMILSEFIGSMIISDYLHNTPGEIGPPMFSAAIAAIKSLIQGQNWFDQDLWTFVFLLPVGNQTLHLEHNMNQTQQMVHVFWEFKLQRWWFDYDLS